MTQKRMTLALTAGIIPDDLLVTFSSLLPERLLKQNYIFFYIS